MIMISTTVHRCYNRDYALLYIELTCKNVQHSIAYIDDMSIFDEKWTMHYEAE